MEAAPKHLDGGSARGIRYLRGWHSLGRMASAEDGGSTDMDGDVDRVRAGHEVGGRPDPWARAVGERGRKGGARCGPCWLRSWAGAVTWASAREGDRDGPPEAKAEWGAGRGPHGAEGSRTDRSSGEREKVSFHFQIFPISFF